jgi:hypothetical protein
MTADSEVLMSENEEDANLIKSYASKNIGIKSRV